MLRGAKDFGSHPLSAVKSFGTFRIQCLNLVTNTGILNFEGCLWAERFGGDFQYREKS